MLYIITDVINCDKNAAVPRNDTPLKMHYITYCITPKPLEHNNFQVFPSSYDNTLLSYDQCQILEIHRGLVMANWF